MLLDLCSWWLIPEAPFNERVATLWQCKNNRGATSFPRLFFHGLGGLQQTAKIDKKGIKKSYAGFCGVVHATESSIVSWRPPLYNVCITHFYCLR